MLLAGPSVEATGQTRAVFEVCQSIAKIDPHGHFPANLGTEGLKPLSVHRKRYTIPFISAPIPAPVDVRVSWCWEIPAVGEQVCVQQDCNESCLFLLICRSIFV